MSGSEAVAITAAVADPVPHHGPWRQAGARFLRRPLGVSALAVALALVVLGLVAPRISPYPPFQIWMQYLNHPLGLFHRGHLLGTDVLGRDFLAQVLYGLHETVVASLICAGGATVIGVVAGTLAGWYEGAADAAIGVVVALAAGVPALVVVLMVVLYEAPVVPMWFGVILMLYLWTSIARVVRAAVRPLRSREFVEAARAAGASELRILVRHALPNVTGPIVVGATALVGQAVTLIATIDFLGYGTEQGDKPTLGGLLVDAVPGLGKFMVQPPDRNWVIPAILIALLVVSVNVAGDALDDALNPAGRRE